MAAKTADRVYFGGTASAGLLMADVAGNLDCEHPMSAATGDLTRARIGGVADFGTDLVMVGDYDRSNEYWGGRGVPFVQRLNGAAQPVWRSDWSSIIAPAVTAGDTPKLAIVTEAGEQMIYMTMSLIRAQVGGNASYTTAKLDAQGALQWMTLWNGDNSPTSCEAYPYAVVPDPRGGVIIVGMGSTDCYTAWDTAMASYTADGERRWTMKPVFNGNGNNNISGAAVSSDGRHLYIIGQTAPIFRMRQDVYIAKYALP
jgi:hypothetical protein